MIDGIHYACLESGPELEFVVLTNPDSEYEVVCLNKDSKAFRRLTAPAAQPPAQSRQPDTVGGLEPSARTLTDSPAWTQAEAVAYLRKTGYLPECVKEDALRPLNGEGGTGPPPPYSPHPASQPVGKVHSLAQPALTAVLCAGCLRPTGDSAGDSRQTTALGTKRTRPQR